MLSRHDKKTLTEFQAEFRRAMSSSGGKARCRKAGPVRLHREMAARRLIRQHSALMRIMKEYGSIEKVNMSRFAANLEKMCVSFITAKYGHENLDSDIEKRVKEFFHFMCYELWAT